MAFGNKKIAGVEALVVAGERLAVVDGATYNPGGESREGVAGEAGIVGARGTTRIPFVEVTIFLDRDTSAQAISRTEDATVMLALKNGKGLVLRGAYFAGDGNVDASAGTMVARFEGFSFEEIDL